MDTASREMEDRRKSITRGTSSRIILENNHDAIFIIYNFLRFLNTIYIKICLKNWIFGKQNNYIFFFTLWIFDILRYFSFDVKRTLWRERVLNECIISVRGVQRVNIWVLYPDHMNNIYIGIKFLWDINLRNLVPAFIRITIGNRSINLWIDKSNRCTRHISTINW